MAHFFTEIIANYHLRHPVVILAVLATVEVCIFVAGKKVLIKTKQKNESQKITQIYCVVFNTVCIFLASVKYILKVKYLKVLLKALYK